MTDEQRQAFRDALYDNIGITAQDDPDDGPSYEAELKAIEEAITLRDFALVCKQLAWDWPSFVAQCEELGIEVYADGITYEDTQGFDT